MISPNKIPHHNIKDENIEDYYFDDYRDTYNGDRYVYYSNKNFTKHISQII